MFIRYLQSSTDWCEYNVWTRVSTSLSFMPTIDVRGQQIMQTISWWVILLTDTVAVLDKHSHIKCKYYLKNCACFQYF